jgi:hypothetical protein
MLSIPNVEVSDTTGDEERFEAGKKISQPVFYRFLKICSLLLHMKNIIFRFFSVLNYVRIG